MNKTFRVVFLAGALSSQAIAAINSAGSFLGMNEDAEMESFVRQIFGMIDLHYELPVVIHPNAPGCAYARTMPTGQQYLGVDPVCVGPLRSGQNYNARAVGILCHEIGHILSGHTLNNVSSHREELEADEWAGWAMQKRGMSLDEAQTAFRTFPETASATHPGRADRLQAVARGFNRAQSESRPVPSPPQSAPQPPPVPPVFKPLPPSKEQRTWWEELMAMPMPWAK